MPMGRVSILTGRSGSGKSRYLRSIAAELIKKGEVVAIPTEAVHV